jgi:hypothetical protein
VEKIKFRNKHWEGGRGGSKRELNVTALPMEKGRYAQKERRRNMQRAERGRQNWLY